MEGYSKRISCPYRTLNVPSDAPFELRPSLGKGWGAFALKRIERGAMILREKPLFVIQKPHEEITEADVWAAFQQLLPSEKQQFLCLRDNSCRPFTQMTQVYAENSFAISNGVRPQANSRPMHGLFLLHSRLNHSCVPNSKIPVVNGKIIASFATRDIVAGEEITFCYNTDFECRTRYDRHQKLRFVCDCKACLTGTHFQQLSDMRRMFIRGLQHLTLGADLDGKGQGSAPPIIIDSKLKTAAEDFSIPLSSRLIYNLLVVYLLEEEELLDDFMAERLNPGILKVAASFKTESNARIARLAITQKTWLEKTVTIVLSWRRAFLKNIPRQHVLALPRQPVTASGTGLRREVEVGVDEPVVEVLYKGEAALRVPEVVLHVGQVDDGIEVVHQLHAEFIGLNGKVLCQATELLHRQVEAGHPPDRQRVRSHGDSGTPLVGTGQHQAAHIAAAAIARVPQHRSRPWEARHTRGRGVAERRSAQRGTGCTSLRIGSSDRLGRSQERR
ncbi:hypothetical protein O988_02687 [Pseudogymnoascus sp. VKM F-3808]|nr:hypothetical protein O988_02687 [Pseudogymnoascus sp. VKM F-3808]